MNWILGLFLAVSPENSAKVATFLFSQPQLEKVLLKICKRESRCRPVNAHALDARWGSKAYARAAYKGWVDPKCQPYAPGQYSTRGSFGLMAAYHLHFLAPCAPPQALDIPLLSALAAAQKLTEHCSRRPKDRIAATDRWLETRTNAHCKKRWRGRAKKLDYRLARSLVRGVLSVLMASPKKDKEVPGRTDDSSTRLDENGLRVVEPPKRIDDGQPVKPLKRMG